MRNKIRVGIDVDDVLYDCNGKAVSMLNEEYGTSYTLNDIKNWGLTGSILDERLKYMELASFQRTQEVLPGAKEFIHNLSKIAEIFITSAVKPQFMGIRAERLLNDFPELEPENIILGGRKDLYNLDFCLDDSGHNVESSQATYPVLMRKPWNYHLTGLLSVNTYDEFLQYIRHIVYAEPMDISSADIICLIAPSGSGKTDIINEVMYTGKFGHPIAFSTASHTAGYINVTHDEFEALRGEFFETSVYAGEQYGYRRKDIEKACEKSKAILAVDICGAMAIKLAFPNTALVYVNRSKQEMIMNILKMNISDECKTFRMMALDEEKKNEDLCDVSVSSAQELLNLLA